MRAQKPAGALKDDLPQEVLAMTGMVEEQKMPEGWNPSDDSEDDYTPIVQVKNKRRRRRRKSEDDSDSEEEEFQEKKMKVSHGRRRKASKVLSTRVAHHQVERVMEAVAEKKELMKEFLEAVREARIASSSIVVLEELLEPSVEEINNCLLCAGKDRDGINLSLDP